MRMRKGGDRYTARKQGIGEEGRRIEGVSGILTYLLEKTVLNKLPRSSTYLIVLVEATISKKSCVWSLRPEDER